MDVVVPHGVIDTGVDLAADKSPTHRAFRLFQSVFMGFVGLFFVAGPVTFLDDWGRTRARFSGANKPPEVPVLVIAVPVGIGLLVIGFSVILALRAFRSAAWLDGTTAYVRGALRTRSIDLSTAYVSAGGSTRQAHTTAGSVHHVMVWSVPTLEAHEPATGRKLTIELCRPSGGAIPPYALRALADAMTRGRGWDGNDRDVHQLAQRLRDLADQSSTVPGRHVPVVPAGDLAPATDPWRSSESHTAASWQPEAPDSMHFDTAGTPAPVRRQSNTGLLVSVGVLAVVLAGGLTAVGLIYVDKMGGSDPAATDSGSDDSGKGLPVLDAGSDKPLPSGKSVLVTEGDVQVNIKIDKIATYAAACGPGAFAPQEGHYITAQVTYQVVKGTATVNSLNFSYLDGDGRSYRAVPAGYSGCASGDLPIAGGGKPGVTTSGYISFDGPEHGTIVYGGQGRQIAWQVG